jgi:hypothetical protein
VTAALIRVLAGVDRVDESVREAATDLRALGADADPPADVADLCRQVAAVSGVDLGRLLTALAPGPDTAQQMLQELTAAARTLATAPPVISSRLLATWDPALAALLAADGGDIRAAAALDAELGRYQDSANWGPLVAALRRMRAGEVGPGLLAGLDEIDAAIITCALDARDGKVIIPVSLGPAVGIGPLLGDVVAGAAGDADGAAQARQDLAVMAEDPDLAPLASALAHILDGDRDPHLIAQLSDPVHSAVVMTVLHHIGD